MSVLLPPEVFGHIVRFIPTIRTFFNVLLLSKEIRRYLETEDSECASHLVFTIRSPTKPARRLKLNVGPSRRGLRRKGHFEEYEMTVPKSVPQRQLSTIESLFPDVTAKSYRDFPYERPSAQPSDDSDEDTVDLTTTLPVCPCVCKIQSRHRIESSDEFKSLLQCFPILHSARLHNVVHCSAEEFSVLQKPLRFLDLQQCGISDADFGCEALSSLRNLRIRACGESGAITLGLLHHLPNLLSLEIECIVETFSWSAGNDTLAQHPLRKLVLSNTSVGQTLSNGAFGIFKSLETLVVSRVVGVDDSAFSGLAASCRKLVVHMCHNITKEGVKRNCGADSVALMDEFVVNVVPEFRGRRAGKMRGPSQYQREAARIANEKRLRRLGKQFQLKHVM